MITRISKVYEAYSALADKRVEKIDASCFLVTSSDYSKKYTVKRNGSLFSSNDNATLWQHYAGYSILSVLLREGEISYDRSILPLLHGINWKKENREMKNDYAKAIEHVLSSFSKEDREKIEKERNKTYLFVQGLPFIVKGNRAKILPAKKEERKA